MTPHATENIAPAAASTRVAPNIAPLFRDGIPRGEESASIDVGPRVYPFRFLRTSSTRDDVGGGARGEDTTKRAYKADASSKRSLSSSCAAGLTGTVKVFVVDVLVVGHHDRARHCCFFAVFLVNVHTTFSARLRSRKIVYGRRGPEVVSKLQRFSPGERIVALPSLRPLLTCKVHVEPESKSLAPS